MYILKRKNRSLFYFSLMAGQKIAPLLSGVYITGILFESFY